eukprot:TRINITY_DN701_c0_g1_i1.p1 TRINITY_DN701_c0_g1~~TRINITY_DN701_c0_g1_i1.p1  ORF type:complete len:182 (-),score=48.20 TRINITY_DN701_c0_g1_i1:187-732(-)
MLPEFVSLISNSFKNASWDKMQQILADPKRPWTLTHGDFHASNMILNGSDTGGYLERIRIYDWAEVGPWEPTTDLGQMVISDLGRDLYAEFIPAAVRSYWERLIQGGVSPTDYPFEACWQSFCIGGLDRWAFIFPLLATFPGIPAAAVQYFHDQMCAFVEQFALQDGKWPQSIQYKTVIAV